MARQLNKDEELLAELVHYISYSTSTDKGLTYKEIKWWLTNPIPHKDGKNALDCLSEEGQAFINEIKTFMNALENRKKK